MKGSRGHSLLRDVKTIPTLQFITNTWSCQANAKLYGPVARFPPVNTSLRLLHQKHNCDADFSR
jgi:hypothetical protein